MFYKSYISAYASYSKLKQEPGRIDLDDRTRKPTLVGYDNFLFLKTRLKYRYGFKYFNLFMSPSGKKYIITERRKIRAEEDLAYNNALSNLLDEETFDVIQDILSLSNNIYIDLNDLNPRKFPAFYK